MAHAGPQNLGLTGARPNSHIPFKKGNNYCAPGRTYLKGANQPAYQEEYIGRDFGFATLGITAHMPVTCTIELYGRGGDSTVPILLDTIQLTNENAKAHRYEGPCFDFMGVKLVSIGADQALEGVSFLEYQ